MHKSQCFCLIYNFFRVHTSSITYIPSLTVCKYLLFHSFAFSITARVVVLPNFEIRASEIQIQFRIRVSAPIFEKGGAPETSPPFRGVPRNFAPFSKMYRDTLHHAAPCNRACNTKHRSLYGILLHWYNVVAYHDFKYTLLANCHDRLLFNFLFQN